MASEKTYTVQFINSRRERWKWLLIPTTVVGAPLTAVALGTLLSRVLGTAFGLIGVITGIGIWLTATWYFGKWTEEQASATIGPDSVVVVKQKTGEREEFSFDKLIKYRVLISFRGAASLRLIAQNGHQLILRGSASPEFTALIKEFDVACLQYERISGRRIMRIDMG